MNDKTKSTLTTAFMMFVFEFADPSTIDKSSLKEKLGYDPMDVFESQKKADRAKQVLGRSDFAKLLSLYFASFLKSEDFDYSNLSEVLNKRKKVFERHLGKDKMKFLNLLTSTMKSLEIPAPRRGLLGACA